MEQNGIDDIEFPNILQALSDRGIFRRGAVLFRDAEI